MVLEIRQILILFILVIYDIYTMNTLLYMFAQYVLSVESDAAYLA